jgi:hypothetical protein
MSESNRVIDLDILSPSERAVYEALSTEAKQAFLGYGHRGKMIYFDVPTFIQTQFEHATQHGNAFIVMGLDRPASGITSRRETHSAAIDIVAGRKGFRARGRDDKDEEVMVDPDMTLDAARVYISQRSNPDGNFRLAPGTVGNTTDASPRSTVAIKADTLRFIARENIKLVTRTDAYNSQGGELKNTSTIPYGIDLIGCNDSADMQPLVKGENLRECLSAIVGTINELRGLFNNFVDETRQMHIALAPHTHIMTWPGTPSLPDLANLTKQALVTVIKNASDVTAQLPMHAAKCAFIETNYLGATEVAEATENGKSTYILSRYNNTN